MKKSKSNTMVSENKTGLASLSLIIFLLDKLSDVIYNALQNGFFGKIFTAYSSEQAMFDNGLIKNHFSNSSKLKQYTRAFKKYLSQAFESSLFLNKLEGISDTIVSFPIRSIGIFMFSFGIYVVIMYLIRLFLPIISSADTSFVIIGIIVCISAIPMLLSRDNVAGAVGKSAALGSLFSQGFGFREESFKRRTETSRLKINLLIILGILLGVSTLVIHPLWIIAAIFLTVTIALIITSPEIGIVLVIFAIPFLSILDSPAIAAGLLVLTVIISFFVKFIRGKRILRFEIIDFAVLFFLIIIFFSGTITAGGSFGYQEVLITSELMLGYFLVVNLIRTEKWVYRCVFSIASSGTIVAMIGILQYFLGEFSTGAWLDNGYFYDIEGRATSLFDNPNILAMYLVMILPFTLLAFIKANGRSARLLWIISISSVLGCIVLTWSRAAWIASVFAVLLFLIIYSRKTLRYIFLTAIFSPLLISFLPESIMRRLSSIGDLADSSTMYRLYTWRGTVKAIGDYFIGGIGYGPNAFREIYPQYAYAGIEAAEHSHNLFLQIIIGTGIVGLVAFAIIMFLFMQMNFEYLKVSDGKFSLIVSACICAISAMLIFGMFDFIWYNYRILFLFWVVIAISVACVRIGNDDKRRHGYNSDTEII